MALTLSELTKRYDIVCNIKHIDKVPDNFEGKNPDKWLGHRHFFNFVIGHLDAEMIAAQVAYQAVCEAARLAGEDEEVITKWKEFVRPDVNRYNRYHAFSH